jgi:hypothetical protein
VGRYDLCGFIDLFTLSLTLTSLLFLSPLSLSLLQVVPTLMKNYFEHGFEYTVCTPPKAWYLHGAPGFWMVRRLNHTTTVTEDTQTTTEDATPSLLQD